MFIMDSGCFLAHFSDIISVTEQVTFWGWGWWV